MLQSSYVPADGAPVANNKPSYPNGTNIGVIKNGVIKNGVIKNGDGGSARDTTAVAMEASWKGQCCGQEKGADGLGKNNFLKGHPRAAWGIGTDV